MNKEQAIAILENVKYELSNQVASKHCRAKYEATEMAIKALEQSTINNDWYDIPSDEMTLEQARQAVKDLRKKLVEQPSDETIKYLECNNIDVQEFIKAMKKQPLQVIKPNICDDCVSRQAVLDCLTATGLKKFDFILDAREKVNNLPPVTPTQCIAEVKFSKDDLREICNERIEIECTHGTCKDCSHYDPLTCNSGTCLNPNMQWSNEVSAMHYCADYEMRGAENE